MLLDVGVWLAAAWADHQFHSRVRDWLSDRTENLAMCRVAQMGVLRLLSTPAVMGTQVLSRAEAWMAVDRLRDDDRVGWALEPPNLEPVWRAISARPDNSHRLWTDDYLAAFAQVSGMTLATLDRGFKRRYPSVSVETLL
ncbi:MAG: TA system VapC family ribonuclease toxin [Micromonosporaceae bacterium]